MILTAISTRCDDAISFEFRVEFFSLFLGLPRFLGLEALWPRV